MFSKKDIIRISVSIFIIVLSLTSISAQSDKKKKLHVTSVAAIDAYKGKAPEKAGLFSLLTTFNRIIKYPICVHPKTIVKPKGFINKKTGFHGRYRKRYAGEAGMINNL